MNINVDKFNLITDQNKNKKKTIIFNNKHTKQDHRYYILYPLLLLIFIISL